MNEAAAYEHLIQAAFRNLPGAEIEIGNHFCEGVVSGPEQILLGA